MSRSAAIVAVLVALIVAGAVAVAATTSGPRSSQTTWFAVAAVIGATIVLLAVVVATRTRRRRRSRAAASPASRAAERLGLAYDERAERGFHHAFGPLPGVPRSGDIRNVMTGSLGGRPLTVFQHSYVVNTGQAAFPVYHTVYVTTAPNWPSLRVTSRALPARILYRLGVRRGLLLEDEAFNVVRRVRTDHEDFAVTMLGPDMQTFLAEKPAVSWQIHPGFLAMIYGGALRPDRMEASLERLREFWSHVPPEMDRW